MKYSKIYKKQNWKEKINYNKIIVYTWNNLIIITCVKQCKAQIQKKKLYMM
jgi:hypothetical protein